MPGFDVTPYMVGGASTDVLECGSSLRAELESLAAQVESLLGSQWRGAAATGFVRGWDEWSAGARAALAALVAMAESLDQTARSYACAEAASVVTS